MSSEIPLSRCQHLKIRDFGTFVDLAAFWYLYPWYLTSSNSKNLLTIPFLKKLNKMFQVHLNILPKLWLIFCCYQQKIWKIKNYNFKNTS